MLTSGSKGVSPAAVHALLGQLHCQLELIQPHVAQWPMRVRIAHAQIAHALLSPPGARRVKKLAGKDLEGDWEVDLNASPIATHRAFTSSLSHRIQLRGFCDRWRQYSGTIPSKTGTRSRGGLRTTHREAAVGKRSRPSGNAIGSSARRPWPLLGRTMRGTQF